MKKKFTFLLMALCLTIGTFAQNLTLKDINIRDPFILPLEKEGVYYMYATSSVTENGKTYGGMVVYKSKDLKNRDFCSVCGADFKNGRHSAYLHVSWCGTQVYQLY